jgi:MFS transporter, DHA3 family, macrolide efflux protein
VRTFTILWLGQMVSAIGSSMTYFALTLWIWQRTESVSAIALITFCFQLPQIAVVLFSGILVDRVPRKLLLLLSDTVAAVGTLSVGILSAAQSLQPWHLYVIAAILGCFENIQSLTYATTVPLIVPKEHHTRAISMGSVVRSGSAILAPAFAGILYSSMGLLGITLIDLSTFIVAIATLLIIRIPKLRVESESVNQAANIKQTWQTITFGFRYIATQPALLTMIVTMSLFAFLNQIGETLYQPMILARTGGDTQVLGTVVAASGIGGVVGAVILSLWSGFNRRVLGMLVGFIGTGISAFFMGVGQLPLIWIVAQCVASLFDPLVFSSYTAVWYAKVVPELQGRVFAADHLVGLVIESSANLVAGVLADQVFEPAVRSSQGVATVAKSIVGAGPGSGISLLYTIHAIGLLGLGVGGYAVRKLRDAELLMPDQEATSDSIQD